MKKNKIALALAMLMLLPTPGMAYERQNSFTNAKGQNRINEIKRFQANNNLNVTGTLNKQTSNMLKNENLMAYDKVEKPPTKGYWITINKTTKILTVYKGSEVDVKFPITLGSSKTPTPSGKGKINSKYVNPAWGGMGGKYTPRAANDPLNPLGERWMGLYLKGYNGYGIHGTIKPHQIGTYVSNGCIRMFNYDIENYVFPKMKVGDPVWLGTDSELQKWGVYQYVDSTQNNPEKPKKPIEKPVEKPEEKDIDIIIEKPKYTLADGINLLVNGEKWPNSGEYAYYIKDDRTFVPLRLVAEKLGFEVSWSDEDKEISLVKDNKTLILKIDNPVIFIKDNETLKHNNLKIDVAPFAVNERTYVPIRFISEALGSLVDYDEDSKTITIEDSTEDIKDEGRNTDESMNLEDANENVQDPDVFLLP